MHVRMLMDMTEGTKVSFANNDPFDTTIGYASKDIKKQSYEIG